LKRFKVVIGVSPYGTSLPLYVKILHFKVSITIFQRYNKNL
jgi:hypothetical protein